MVILKALWVYFQSRGNISEVCINSQGYELELAKRGLHTLAM